MSEHRHETPLVELLDPSTPEAFAESYWPDQLWVAPPSLTRTRLARRLAASASGAFGAHRGELRLAAPGAAGETTFLAGLSAAEAEDRYQRGATVLLGMAAETEPFLGQIARALDELTGVPPGSCDFLVHLGKPKTGFSVHFDNQDVMVLQLSGRKTWHLGLAPAVAYPTASHVIGRPLDPELLTYWSEGRTLEPGYQPVPHQEVTLEPGSLLFVPRGHWHWTEAVEESVSVSFGFHTPSWADVVSAWVAAELGREGSFWLQPSRERWGQAGTAELLAARQAITSGLAELPTRLAGVSPAEVRAAFSLRRNFAAGQRDHEPSWSRVFGRELRQRWILDPRWRQSAFSGWGAVPGRWRQRADEALRHLLASAGDAGVLPSVEQILGVGDRYSDLAALRAAWRESFDAGAAMEVAARFQFQLSDALTESFGLVVSAGELSWVEGGVDRPDLVITVSRDLLLEAGRSRRRAVELVAAGRMRLAPYRPALLDVLVRCFRHWNS